MPPLTTVTPDCCNVGGQQAFGDDAGAFQGAFLAFAELRLSSELERNSLRGNDVLQRATLLSGENRGVDLLGDVGVVGQDHTTARAAKGLVGGARDDVGVRHRVGVKTRGHQAGEMRHVHHQVGAHQVRDTAELGEVQLPGVGGPAGDDQLRLVLNRQALDFSHVNQHGVFGDAIRDHFVELAGEVDAHAVGQVAAVCEVQPQDGVAGLDQGEHRRCVGLGAGVGLDISEFGAEE